MTYLTPKAIMTALNDTAWATFIEPDHTLQAFTDINDKYRISIPSGYKADFSPFQDSSFQFIVSKILAQRDSITYEEQCSAQYYYDSYQIIKAHTGKINRIVEAGVFLGGGSLIYAGCAAQMNITLDLIDINKEYLWFAYERIRRAFPEMASKVRLFFGTIPLYVKNVLSVENEVACIFQHDAAHIFQEVVKDLSALSFVKNKIQGVMIQDTHLRSTDINRFTFVDAALFAIFGPNMQYQEMGVKFVDPFPPKAQLYFLDNQTEGMFVPFAINQFRYPHATMFLDQFLHG